MAETIINKPTLNKEAPVMDTTNAEAEAMMAQEEPIVKAKPAVNKPVKKAPVTKAEPVVEKELPLTIPCDCKEGVNKRLNMVDNTYRCPKCHSWVSTEVAMNSDEIKAKKKAELEKQLKALED